MAEVVKCQVEQKYGIVLDNSWKFLKERFSYGLKVQDL